MQHSQSKGELEAYARATWHSIERMLVPASGLPADYIGGDLEPETRARYTSPTNVATYVWSLLGARDLGLISSADASERARRVLDSLLQLERHAPTGQYYNWYDPESGSKLTAWPERPEDRVYPFASSVDNGWLGSALCMLSSAMPVLRERASQLAASLDFACYYDAHAEGPGKRPGLLRGGFWREGEEPPGNAGLPRGDYSRAGETLVYTGHHYGAINTEPRITSYLAIALGQVPPEHYFSAWRTFPDSYDHTWQAAPPSGTWRTYRGVPVFEGAYTYGGRRFVPTWGGSMFEALMPTLVVPERRWGERSWALTHPVYVQAQIEFGLQNHGYWGFSPASDPHGGYREYGVDAIGMLPGGYLDRGVVTPHAVFLALPFAPEAALDNLRALRRDFPALYGAGGFRDSVDVRAGKVAHRYLVLDQGMVLAAITNALLADRLHDYLAPALEATLRPLMQMEEFGTS